MTTEQKLGEGTENTETQTPTEELTDYYHSLEAADGIRDTDLTLIFETIGKGPSKRGHGAYYRITDDTPELGHDWAFLPFETVFQTVLESDIHWPSNLFEALHNTRVTATDLSIGTHAGTITLHTDVLPEPLPCRTDNWRPESARRKHNLHTTKNESDAPRTLRNLIEQDHAEAFENITRDFELANQLTLSESTWVTGVVQEPSRNNSSSATYPVEIPTDNTAFEIPFTVTLPSRNSSFDRRSTEFEDLVEEAGGSPEHIPGTEVAIIPSSRISEDDAITSTGTGSKPGRWSLTTIKTARDNSEPLHKRFLKWFTT